MSAGICNIQKVTNAADITGMQIHERRERPHSNSNPDIDFNRGGENYSLCNRADGKSFNAAIDEIISNEYTSTRKIRKDAVKMCKILFTSDSKFFADKAPSEQRAFFESCYQWAAQKYGEQNIISAVVHMDEKTPHMHLNFVPLVKDINKKTGEVITTLNVHKAVGSGSRAFQQIQDDFYKAVGKPYGLERGNRTEFDNGERPRKHQRTEQYKQTTKYHQTTINALQATVQALQATQSTLTDILHTEPQNVIQSVPVPSVAKLALNKEHKDKVLVSPTDMKQLQELAKATAVVAAGNESKESELSERAAQLEIDRQYILKQAEQQAERIIAAAKEKEQELSQAGNEYYFRNKKEADELLQQANYRINSVTEREQTVNWKEKQIEQRTSELDEREKEITHQLNEIAELKDRPDEYYLQKIAEKDEETDNLNINICALQMQIEEKSVEIRQQQTEIDNLNREISKLGFDCDDLQEQNGSLSERNRVLEDELNAKEQLLSEKEKKIEDTLAGANHNYDLYNAACDIGERLDDYFNDKVNQRMDGYSVAHIFGDNRNRGYER